MNIKFELIAERYLTRRVALRLAFSILLFTVLTGPGLVATHFEFSKSSPAKSRVSGYSERPRSWEARGIATANSLTRPSSGPVNVALGLPGTPQTTSSPDTVITNCNPNPVTINNVTPSPTKSSPYPSDIFVAGITGTVSRITVTLNNISHTFPDDIEVLLVSPTGLKVTLMGDVGGGTDITGVNLTFDDAAASQLPDSTVLSSGTFRPTYFGTGSTNGFPAPAPTGPYSATLAAFSGMNPNGTWSLYVVDDLLGDIGSIAGGWRLEITAHVGGCNATAITINNGTTSPTEASPYPSDIFVTGMTGAISRVTVTLNNINHTKPDEVDVLLVGPGGHSAIIMSDVGGGAPVNNVTLTLDDTASTFLSETGSLVSGTFKPTDIDPADLFNPPAPTPAGGSSLSIFNGTDPNGTWSLYVVADATGSSGSFAGGWCLTFVMEGCSVCCFDITASNDVNQCGAVVNYQSPLSGTCGPTTCTPPSGSFFPVGTTSVICTSTLEYSCSFAVRVQDIQAPVIVCPADIVTTNEPGTCGAAVDFAIPTASDNCQTVTTTTCSSPPGSFFPLGTTPVTCNVRDSAGNQSGCSFNITVLDNEGVSSNRTPVTFCNPNPVTINNVTPFPTKSSPYPSDIFVTGMTGRVCRVSVTLNNINHTFPDDIDILLVGPGGQSVVLMSDVGGGTDIFGRNLTFDAAAASTIPDAGPLVSGAFKPSNVNTTDTFPAPAPPGPYSTTLAAFSGTNQNGTWSLYVVDDSLGDGGNIAGGWCLTLLPSINNAPTASPQNLTTAEDTPLPLTLTGSDVDGDVLTFAVTTPPNNGTLSGTAPNLSYTPNSNFNGSDSFTFTVNDGALNSATATVSIIVTPINDPPIVSSLVASPDIGTAPLLVSFSVAASDIDGSISSVQWDFNGDGITDQTTPTLSTSTTYQTGGVFNAVATVIDNLGGMASSSVIVSVRDFALSATPASQSVNPGSSTAYTVSITSLAGFNSAVSCTTSVSPQTNGVNTNVSPGSLVPSGTAFLTVDTTPSAALGNYTITVTGTSGTLIRSTTVTLSITTAPQAQDFTLQATPTLQSAVQSTAFSTGISTEVSVISLNGFTSPVSLSISGLPAGATASFSSNPVTPTALSQLAVILPAGTATGTYSLTVTGASGNLSHSAPITLNVISPPATGNTPASSGPVAVAIGAGVTATYSSIASAGTTTVTTSTTGAPPPAGFKLAGVYYEISTTAVFSGTVTICINYADSPNEQNYQLMHKSAGGNWERVTLPGYPDTVANIICGEVTSFSEFAAMEMEPLITGGGQSGTVDQYLTPVSVTVYPSGQVQQITDRVVTIPVGTTRIDVSYRFGPGATPSSLSVEFNGVEVLASGSIPDTATGVVVHGLGSLRSRNTLIGVIGGNTSNARDRDRLTLVFP